MDARPGTVADSRPAHAASRRRRRLWRRIADLRRGSPAHGGHRVRALDRPTRAPPRPYAPVAQTMLDVRPVPEPSRWSKTDRMRETAAKLNRADAFFSLPI